MAPDASRAPPTRPGTHPRGVRVGPRAPATRPPRGAALGAWALPTVALSFATAPLPAQVGEVPVSFEHWSVDQGLAQSTGRAILQDSRGFLWIGTQDGLSRFDGQGFETFTHDPRQPGSLPGGDVTALYEDASGTLWIGTTGGLARLRPGGAGSGPPAVPGPFERFHHDPGDPGTLSSDDVLDLAGEPGRGLWVTTAAGLDLLAEGSDRVRRVRLPFPGRETVRVGGVAVSPRGEVWVGGSGLWLRSPGTEVFREVPGPDGNAILDVSDLQVDPEGVVWVAGRDRLHRVEPAPTPVARPVEVPGPGASASSAVLVDRAGVVWLGFREGLARLDPLTGRADLLIHDPDDPTSLGPGGVFSLHQGRSGILWVGTGRGGFSRVVARVRFSHVAPEPGGLSHGYITGVASGAGDVLWIGTGGGGLNRLHRPTGRVTVLDLPEEGPEHSGGAYVYDVLEDRLGTLWVASVQGLAVRRPGSAALESVTPARGSHGPVLAAGTGLHEGPGGGVWSAFYHDLTGWVLHRYGAGNPSGVAARRVPLGDGLDRSATVQAILEDRRGRVWVGTNGGGLVVTDTAGVDPLRHRARDPSEAGGLTNDFIQSLHEDGGGRIWVGTRGGGLSRWDAERDGFRHHGMADGLPNDVVYAIEEDAAGFLWLSTNRGLARFDPRTGRVLAYDVSDGLQGNEFNRWASDRAPDGFLAFGGLNGLTVFDPLDIDANPVPPTVALRDLRVRNRSLSTGPLGPPATELVLTHDQNVLTFDLAALHFANPARNRLRYRLDGLEEEWTEDGPRALARYANLAPGRYTLRAEAANSDGVWSAGALVLPVQVRPPWWSTWWFAVLSALAMGSALGGAHRVRVARVLAEERLRTRIARDLHDDVSATLSGITYFAHALGGDLADAERSRARYLDLIARSAAEARDRIGDIVWAISPEHDSWPAVLARLRRHASDLLSGHGVDHEIRMPETLKFPVLGPERRQHLWLFYKEALANVIRHAGASRVEVALTHRGGRLTLVVADDGMGFDPGDVGGGHGLANLRARAVSLGATAQLETAPGRGTRWTLEFDVGA